MELIVTSFLTHDPPSGLFTGSLCGIISKPARPGITGATSYYLRRHYPITRRSQMYFWYCMLAIVAGTLIPLQAGINAELKRQLSSPYYATLISVLVSSVAISLVCIAARLPLPNAATLASVPWWVWTGGIVGVVYVFMVLILAPKLGATALIASIIGGQMLCSLFLDQFALIGFAQHALSPGRIAGLVLLFSGVFLIQRY